MRLDRMLAIVLILLNRRRATAPELAERFDVSVRTIYRDIDTIDGAGIPIVSFQGKGGGFGIVESYRLERQLLTPDDMLALLGVLRGVGAALKDRQLDASSRKIESLISEPERRRLSDEIKIDLTPWGYRGQEDAFLETLRMATQRQQLVRLTYLNSMGGTIDRTVEPMTLVFKGSAWYLFAFCRLKKDYRLFRITRMRGLAGLEETFARRDLCYDDFAKRSQSRADSLTITCELKFSKEMRFLVEESFQPHQISRLECASLLVRADLPDGEWIYGWLLSFGEHLEVLAPSHVRDTMIKRVTAMADQY